MFARATFDSASARRAALAIGYSDKVRVYLNGVHLYSGDNTYRTRDFRYLGTIGLYDSVILPLQAGENELLLAVSEQFGGWGVMASLDP